MRIREKIGEHSQSFGVHGLEVLEIPITEGFEFGGQKAAFLRIFYSGFDVRLTLLASGLAPGSDVLRPSLRRRPLCIESAL